MSIMDLGDWPLMKSFKKSLKLATMVFGSNTSSFMGIDFQNESAMYSFAESPAERVLSW